VYRTTLNAADFLSECVALGLLAPERREQFAALLGAVSTPDEQSALLVEEGVLTSYQAEQIRAGHGRRLLVGPYLLLEKLGAGGMGHVFKAEHRLMKRVVALKLVGRARRRRNKGAVLVRFQREVEAAARLRHDHIVTAYDAGEASGRLFLAMEYVEGIDLGRLVKDSGPLSVELACEVVRQAAEALAYAHERGLVHRDVKPSNLMLVSPGVTVKLLDMGLARLKDRGWSVDVADDGLSGTPDFMAPENGQDCSQVDARGDLYSLGCTFYFLLTGQVPYPGGSWPEKLLRHSLDLPAPVWELRPDLPAEIAFVVERLMARDVEDRYPTAAAVVAAVQAALASPTNPVATVTVETPRRKAARRIVSPRLSFGVLAAILCGVVFASGARWLIQNPRPVPTVSRTTTPPRREMMPRPIEIVGRSEKYSTLERAIAAAKDGDVLTIRGPGPFVTSSLNCEGKNLTLRAVEKSTPRIELRRGDDPWQALFQTDRSLTLEGLDLHGPAPLILADRAALRLTNCRLSSGKNGVVIVARNPSELIVSDCRIDAGEVGISIEVGKGATCQVRIAGSRVRMADPSGASISLWAPEVCQPTAIELTMERNWLQAGRIVALRSLPAGLTMTAHGNRFTYGTAILSFGGYADRDAWKRGVNCRGEDNHHEGAADWLRVNSRPVPASELTQAR
jgi:serine/threonine-protein kinase